MSEKSRTQHVPNRMANQDARTRGPEFHPDAISPPDNCSVGTPRAVTRTAITRPAQSSACSGTRRVATATGGGLLLVGVALAAANMRPPVTSLASMLGETRDSLGASAMWASVLTALPTLCFGIVGSVAPSLSRRFGMHRTVGVS